jgi:lysophospholipase L1-like esterase
MTMSQFHMLFLGDSVVWGQGLADEHKFSTKLVNWVNQWHGATMTAVKTEFAHSGAVIGVGKPGGGLRLHGEVPTELPSIMEQVTFFNGHPQDIDLVVLDGGINDVGVSWIANPFTGTDEIRTEVDQRCRQDMTTLILHAAQRFNKASTRILVTGYYPVLSPQSNLQLIPILLTILGVAIPTIPFASGVLNPLDRVIDNFLEFWKASRNALQLAVQEANTQLGVQKAHFVDPPILEENAAFAPLPWVFGINPDLGPQDAISGARRIVCIAQEPNLLKREKCFRASAGHPNIWGADAYFRALYPKLQQLYGL